MSTFNRDPQVYLSAFDIIEDPAFELTQEWFDKLYSVEYGEEAILNWAEVLGFEYDKKAEFFPVGAAVEFILDAPARAKKAARAEKARAKKAAKAEKDKAQRAMIRMQIRPFIGSWETGA